MPRKRIPDGPARATSSRDAGRRPPLLLMVAAAAVIATLVMVAANTPVGRLWTAYVFVVLHVYIGVVTLVALSLTVMAGLVSTDRLVLRIGHRVLMQGVHRATAVIAVVALGVHIAVKVLEAHAGLGDVLVPFSSRNRSMFIGFGTIAAYLLLLAFWSGMARARFIGRVQPWVWRLLHSCAYLSWPIALLHGLNAGRQAATWVLVSYIGCLILVGLGLLVRVYSSFGRFAAEPKPGGGTGGRAETVVRPRMPAPRPAFMDEPAADRRHLRLVDADRPGEREERWTGTEGRGRRLR
jgi:hypothetical protein